jgi:predicted transcriptional regulator
MGVLWLPEIRRRILVGLRQGPLDLYQLAADLTEPPFRVRAELKALRRDRLVSNRIANGRIEWTLTERGETIAYHEDQLQLTEVH